MATLAPRPSLAAAPPSLSSLRLALRSATRDCLERNLPAAAKFAGELLAALPAPTPRARSPAQPGPSRSTPHHHPLHHPPSPHVHFRTSTPVKSADGTPAGATAGGVAGARPSLSGLPPMGSFRAGGARDSLGSVLSMGPASSPVVERSAALDVDDVDADMHPDGGGGPPSGGGGAWAEGEQRAEWRARDDDEQDLYALALAYAGEKRLQEEAGELLGVKDRPQPNPFTQELLEEMAGWESGFLENDGWLLYLKALLLLSLMPTAPAPLGPRGPDAPPPALDYRLAALETLVNSVRLEPYNWSAWLKIAECLDGPEELDATLPFLPSCYPLLFFYVHATLEIHAAGDVLHDVLDELEGVFGSECSAVTGMRALVHYHVREFDEATALFTTLQTTDPYRLDDVDVLSNILYVSEKRAELATLAQEYTRLDRMRPEVCCLIGNYYSLRRDHEKAIVYFRRALKLDRAYLSAWTLMGHEYVEIKNTNAAIASYRRAVDVNRKDYRAWYGLGQTYELLGEPFYALSYYQRATALRPYDARMWSALATCYEKLKRIPDAIRSHQRALLSSEPGDGSDLALRIGKLYASLGQGAPAAAYHRRALAEGVRGGAGPAELGRVYLWLARWEMRRADAEGRAGELGRAEEYLRAVEGAQEFRDEANALLKELEVLMLSRE
ncbi:Anaphase-promoting complex subunit 8 [Rhodotorula kratochvilovae]